MKKLLTILLIAVMVVPLFAERTIDIPTKVPDYGAAAFKFGLVFNGQWTQYQVTANEFGCFVDSIANNALGRQLIYEIKNKYPIPTPYWNDVYGTIKGLRVGDEVIFRTYEGWPVGYWKCKVPEILGFVPIYGMTIYGDPGLMNGQVAYIWWNGRKCRENVTYTSGHKFIELKKLTLENE